jgi:acetyl-CoA C-acetyltransferase
MGETAENVAEKWNISRERQDRFALSSQEKWLAAQEKGAFENEIIPVEIPQRKKDPIIFNTDEHPRLSAFETLAELKPAFRENGTVTAGNASGINDGAACALLVSEEMLKRYQLTPMARIVSFGVAGVDPAYMGIGPVPATQNALKKAGLTLQDMDIMELNEAFAAQVLASMDMLGADPSKVNLNGGSIAIGHPLGASGTRITATLLHQMKSQSQYKYGLATMCIGVGQGSAIIFENLNR